MQKRCRKWMMRMLSVMIAGTFSACGNEATVNQEVMSESSQVAVEQRAQNEDAQTEIAEIKETQATETTVNDSKILVAYFTRLPNTESGDDLDAVVQGGGPYGAIGDSLENADMDAISSASITITDEGTKGNVQTVAEWIAEYTGGDLFSIETVEKYPIDYDTLIDQGGEEQQNNIRPELQTHIENIDQYSVIYLGYPNWYHDMPMALYSFLEEYDLEGKTIVPFVTSAGSGLADTVSDIAKSQPGATVIEDALALRMGDVGNSEETVHSWIDSLSLET